MRARKGDAAHSPHAKGGMIGAYLLMSLTWAAFAVLSAHDRLFDAILAVGFALNAAVFWFKRSSSASDGPAS
jgi:hypothetical protein